MNLNLIIYILIISQLIISTLKPFLLSGSMDRSMKLWNIESGTCFKTFDNLGPINSILTSSKFDLISSSLSEPILLDHSKNLTWTQLTKDKGTTSAALSKDGTIAVLATKSGIIKVIETQTTKSELLLVDHRNKFNDIFKEVKSNSNKFMDASRSIDTSTKVIHDLIHTLTSKLKFKDAIKAVLLNINKFQNVLQSIYKNSRKIHDIANLLFFITKLKQTIKGIEISNDKEFIYIAIEKFVQIMDREKGFLHSKIELESEITAMKQQYYNTNINQENDHYEKLILGCKNGMLQVQSKHGTIQNTILNYLKASISSLYVQNSFFIATYEKGNVFIQDVQNYTLLIAIDPDLDFNSKITSIAKKSTLLFIGYQDGKIVVQDILAKQKVKQINGHTDSISSLNIINIDENQENKEEFFNKFQNDNMDLVKIPTEKPSEPQQDIDNNNFNQVKIKNFIESDKQNVISKQRNFLKEIETLEIIDSLTAIESFKLLIEINEGQQDSYQNLGKLKYQEKSQGESIKYFEKSLEIRKRNVKNQVNIAKIYNDYYKDQDESIHNLNKALEIDPKQIEAINIKGLLYLEQNKLDNAIICFEEVIKIDNSNVDSFLHIGKLQIDYNDQNEAKETFERAIGIDTSNVDTYLKIGKIQNDAKNQDMAMRQIQEAVRINPFNKEAVKMLHEQQD